MKNNDETKAKRLEASLKKDMIKNSLDIQM